MLGCVTLVVWFELCCFVAWFALLCPSVGVFLFGYIWLLVCLNVYVCFDSFGFLCGFGLSISGFVVGLELGYLFVVRVGFVFWFCVYFVFG